MATDPERFRLTLTLTVAAASSAIPIFARLRRLLKTLLRCYGLRCLEIVAVKPPAPEEPPVAP
jgi:hypothetical protein